MFSEIKNFLKASRFLLKCENVVKKLTLWYDVIFKIVGNCGKIIKKLQLYICRMEPKNGSISVMFILGVLTRPISYTIFWNLFWLLNRILHLLFTCCDLNLYSISQLRYTLPTSRGLNGRANFGLYWSPSEEDLCIN